MNLTTRAFPLVAVIAITLSVAGCSAASDNTADPQDTSGKDFASGALPLDEYQYAPGQDVKVAYADALIAQPCLAKKGFNTPVPYLDTSKLDMTVRDPFTEQRAQTAGYHPLAVVQSSADAWHNYAYRTLQPGEQEAIDACNEELSKQQPAAPIATANFVTSLSSAAFESSLRKEPVLTAAAKWRTCMKDAGVPDLPTIPVQMPSQSVATRFGLSDPESPSASTVTEDERALALKDVGCRTSSGFARAQYDAEWDAQDQQLKQNTAELASARKQLEKLDNTVTKIISANAPSAG